MQSVATSDGVFIGFRDDFNRAHGPDLGFVWTVQAGSVDIDSNTVAFNPTAVSIATENTLSLTDAIVQADFMNLTAAGARAGLVARYSGTAELLANFYLGMVWKNTISGKYEAYLFVKHSGNPLYEQLGLTRDLTGLFTGSGTLRFEVVGNQLKLFVNNQLQIVAYDSTIAMAGLVGIRGQASSLDNFSAQTVVLQNATLPFTDNFTNATNGSDLDRVWTEKTGAFAIQDNTASATDVVPGASLATVNGVSVADAVVKADVVLPSNGTYSYAGLVARASGTDEASSSFYLGVVDNAGGTYTAYLFRKLAGSDFVLLGRKNVTATFTPAGTKTLRFEALGNQLKLYVNDVLQVVVYDSTITTAGTVGIRGSNANWDQFSAVASPAITTGTPFTDVFDTPTNRPDLDRVWKEQFGTFSTQNNNAAAALPGISLATLNTTSPLADPTVEAKVNITTVGSYAALVARYSGPGENNFYQAVLFNNGGNHEAYIFVKQMGGFTQLAFQALPGFSGTGTLKFTLTGNMLQLFVDNVLKTAATDSTFATGLVGMRSFGASLDDFNIQ